MFGWIVLSSVAAALVGYRVLVVVARHRLPPVRHRQSLSEPAEMGLEYGVPTWFQAEGEVLSIGVWHSIHEQRNERGDAWPLGRDDAGNTDYNVSSAVATTPASKPLQMRWYRTQHGLRMRWE